MKDIMLMEKIEHEEARKACEGTDYNWMDLLDFESLREVKRRLYSANEQECREAFKEYFEDLVIDSIYYDRNCSLLKEYELVIYYKDGSVVKYYEENEGSRWITDVEDGALQMQEIDEELFGRIMNDDEIERCEIVEFKNGEIVQITHYK